MNNPQANAVVGPRGITKALFGAFLILMLILAIGVLKTDFSSWKSNERHMDLPEEATATPPSELPADPFRRIEAIVRQHGSEAAIFDQQDHLTAETAKPPFQVLASLKMHDCSQAKLRAFEISRDLYIDPIASAALGRVKVMAPGYITTSLGSSAANRLTSDQWRNVGSSIFFKALQAERTYENDAGSKNWAGMTYGIEEAGCRK